MTFAASLPKYSANFEITVFDKSPMVGWAGCPTPYWISNQLIDDHAMGSDGSDFAKRGITVHTNHEVTAVDFASKTLTVSGNTVQGPIQYDILVYAPGAVSQGLPIPGLREAPNTFTLSHALDAKKIKAYLQDAKPKHALVIGAGFIGLEMAESFSHLGLQTTVCDILPHLFPRFARDSADMLTPLYEQAKSARIALELASGITSLEFSKETPSAAQPKAIRSAQLQNGKTITADIILLSTGIKPNTSLFSKAAYPFDEGKILVNEHLETKIPDVYALGDVIHTKNIITGKTVYAPFGDTADKQGIILARHLAGKDTTTFKGVLGAFASSFFNIRIAATGLTKSEAQEAGFDAKSTRVEAKTKISSFADSKGGNMEIVYDNTTKRILGALMIGNEAVAQFTDQVSLAIYNKMTFDDVFMSDYSYSPTNSSVWNPLLAAYRRVMK